jgi:hypothetical protein
MGISGLLPLLSDISNRRKVDVFLGKKVGIDASTWLHKGAYGCAADLARGKQTDGYLRYFMRYIDMLKHYEVEPVVVFDGAPLPMKKLTNDRCPPRQYGWLVDFTRRERRHSLQLGSAHAWHPDLTRWDAGAVETAAPPRPGAISSGRPATNPARRRSTRSASASPTRCERP